MIQIQLLNLGYSRSLLQQSIDYPNNRAIADNILAKYVYGLPYIIQNLTSGNIGIYRVSKRTTDTDILMLTVGNSNNISACIVVNETSVFPIYVKGMTSGDYVGYDSDYIYIVCFHGNRSITASSLRGLPVTMEKIDDSYEQNITALTNTPT